jgi:hypothetical protein
MCVVSSAINVCTKIERTNVTFTTGSWLASKTKHRAFRNFEVPARSLVERSKSARHDMPRDLKCEVGDLATKLIASQNRVEIHPRDTNIQNPGGEELYITTKAITVIKEENGTLFRPVKDRRNGPRPVSNERMLCPSCHVKTLISSEHSSIIS